MKTFFILLFAVLGFVFFTHATMAITDNEQGAIVRIEVGNSVGSGVIIDAWGRILTNYHVVEDAIKNPSSQTIFLCHAIQKNTPPTCYMKARILAAEEGFDLALLQISEITLTSFGTISLDEYRLRFGKHPDGLTYVNFDRSNLTQDVSLSEEVQILGYPAVGGDTITYTKGTVSGFDPLLYKGKYVPFMFKTDAKVNFGNSGGAAFDSDNSFVGIPTAVAGGAGNIGYVTSLPIINLFLQGTLGSSYATTPPSILPSSKGVFQGYLSIKPNVEKPKCPIGADYEVWNDQCICQTGYFAVGDSCVEARIYCEVTGQGKYDLYRQRCEGTPVAKQETPTPSIASPQAPVISAPPVSTESPEAPSVTAPSATSRIPENGRYVSSKRSNALISRLTGHILLQVEEHGEAWYINPKDSTRYYMPDGASAYNMMRSFGLGIADTDLNKIPSVDTPQDMLTSSSACSNALANRFKGSIMLQVQQHGEAWYIDPTKCRRIYMKDGAAAYQIMRFLGLGITNGDLEKLPSEE